MKMKLENVSDDFLDWLSQCPVQWFLCTQTENTIIYEFEKERENND